MDYHARFYSPTIGKFTQPDSIIPSLTNSQFWNRYSYTFNNPVKYTDPSGHCGEDTGEYVGWEYSVCVTTRNFLENQYGAKITGKWKLKEMNVLGLALESIESFLGGNDNLNTVVDIASENNGNMNWIIHRGTENRTNNYIDMKMTMTDWAFGGTNWKRYASYTRPDLNDYSQWERSAIVSVGHEFGHLFQDAYPDASAEYYQMEGVVPYGGLDQPYMNETYKEEETFSVSFGIAISLDPNSDKLSSFYYKDNLDAFLRFRDSGWETQ